MTLRRIRAEFVLDTYDGPGLYYRLVVANRPQEGKTEMKRLITLLALTMLVASLCFAGSVTGYVTDEKCATAGKHGEAHAKCAAGCIGGGATIVLVTEDGKIYQVADSSKLKDHAGHKVMVEGKVEGMKVTSIDKVTMPS